MNLRERVGVRGEPRDLAGLHWDEALVAAIATAEGWNALGGIDLAGNVHILIGTTLKNTIGGV